MAERPERRSGGAITSAFANAGATYGGGPAPGGSNEIDALFEGGPLGLAAGGPAAAETLTVEDLIAGLLADTAEEMLPASAFKYGADDLPHWFPKQLIPLVKTNPKDVAKVYDPYLGIRGQKGDERVYFGQGKVHVDVFDFNDDGTETQRERNKGIGRDARQDRMADMLGDETERTSDDTRRKRRQKGAKTMNYEQALNLPYQWSDKEVQGAMKRMRQAGLNVTSFDQMKGVWAGLVDRASMTYSLSAGKRKVTPWDVLELSKREAVSAGTFTNFESGTDKQVTRSVTEISEGNAWQVLQQTLSTMLGRDPSDQELRDYAYRMNNLAARNPSITETIARYKGGEIISQESETRGGFDAGDMAQEAYEEAQDDPEYGAYQAATTYFNSAIEALGAIGEV